MCLIWFSWFVSYYKSLGDLPSIFGSDGRFPIDARRKIIRNMNWIGLKCLEFSLLICIVFGPIND